MGSYFFLFFSCLIFSYSMRLHKNYKFRNLENWNAVLLSSCKLARLKISAFDTFPEINIRYLLQLFQSNAEVSIFIEINLGAPRDLSLLDRISTFFWGISTFSDRADESFCLEVYRFEQPQRTNSRLDLIVHCLVLVSYNSFGWCVKFSHAFLAGIAHWKFPALRERSEKEDLEHIKN